MSDPNQTKSTKGAAFFRSRADEPHMSEGTRVSARGSAVTEDEVYGALGALLGTLEVIACDDAHPVPPVQSDRLRSALALCQDLQHQIEALLTLSSEDLPERLRHANTRVRPFVEHAVRGARHTFEAHGVTLRMPEGDDWGCELVTIDSSRADRTVRALSERLAAVVGRGGTLTVEVNTRDGRVELLLLGARAEGTDKPVHMPGALLLGRAATRLFELSGGAFSLDAEQLAIRISLPVAEAP
jgi:hypothetical protein